jgi:nitroreductase
MQEKETPNVYPIEDLIKKRWSPVAFDDHAIEMQTILSLFEAARWAPSSFNEQPWSFIVADKSNPEAFEHMLQCLSEGNQAWARAASLLILAVAKLHFDHNGKPNRHAWYDTGAAVMNLVLQATAQDLHAHQMAGFSASKVREMYRIPDTHEPVTAIAIGYAGDSELLSDALRKRNDAPRKRKPVSEFVYAGSWKHRY